MKYKTFFFILIFIISQTIVGFSQKETPPEGGQPRDFNLPAAQKLTLDNGMQVNMVSYGEMPKVNVRVVIRVGNLNEDTDETWLADMTIDLLKEGTQSFNAEEIAKKAADMGGEISSSTGLDQSWIGGEVLSEFAPDLIALLADIVQYPVFPEKEFDRVKKDFLRNLSISKTQSQSLAEEKFREVIYPEHPYGRLFPSEENLKNLTLEQVKTFLEENFGALRSQLYVVGKFNSAEIEKAIRSSFSGWEKGPEPMTNIPTTQSKRKIYLINRPDAPQSTISLGLPVIDPTHADYFPLIVTNTLLCGYYTSSRVTSNIREDKGYTYSPNSTVTTHYRDAHWVQKADVTTDVTGASLKEIFYEIDRLQNEACSANELDGVKNYMAGIFVLRNSSRGGIIRQLSFTNLHGMGEEYLSTYVENVYKVTPQDVQEMAQKYLKDEEMAIVIVGDRKKVPGQVKRFADIIY
jgi:predicted Zn-dependent peptidase